MIDRNQKVMSAYDHSDLLSISITTYKKFLDCYLKMAQMVDLPDITSHSVSLPQVATFVFLAKQSCVVAGIEELTYYSNLLGLHFRPEVKDGDRVFLGTCIATIEGKTEQILSYERFFLNIMQRMSGIATFTSQFKLNHTHLAATRKAPLFLLDKKAVAIGGGLTHRLSLHDAIMVKDTQLDLMSGEQLTSSLIAIEHVKDIHFVCFEVHSLKYLDVFLQFAKVSTHQVVLLFDNFKPDELSGILSKFTVPQQASVIIEVSGGITLSNYTKYDIEGIDVMSVGSLTHSVTSADISLKAER